LSVVFVTQLYPQPCLGSVIDIHEQMEFQLFQALSGDRQSVEIRHCSEDVHVHNCSVCPYMLIPSLLGTLLLERTRSHGCNLSTIFLSINPVIWVFENQNVINMQVYSDCISCLKHM